MKVIEGGFGKQAPDKLIQQLRDIADAMERGEVSEAVVAYISAYEYELIIGCSLVSALTLSTLLHRRVTDKFLQG